MIKLPVHSQTCSAQNYVKLSVSFQTELCIQLRNF
jgi:hypothetical protein